MLLFGKPWKREPWLKDYPTQRAKQIWIRADRRASLSLPALLRLIPFVVVFSVFMAMKISGGNWSSPGGGSVAAGVVGAVIGNALIAAPSLILFVGYVRRQRDYLIWHLVSDEGAFRGDALCKMCNYSIYGLPQDVNDGVQSVTCPECGHLNVQGRSGKNL